MPDTKTIWKFNFKLEDRFTIEMPRNAEVLTVQEQAGGPCLWALVEPANSKEPRRFALYGTGHPVSNEEQRYVGTFQLARGALIFHLFERTGAR